MSAAAEGAEGLCCFAASPTYHGTASSLASPVAADLDPELASITTGRTAAATGACSNEASSEERERLLLRGVSMERAAGARVQVHTRLPPTQPTASPLPPSAPEDRPVLSDGARRVQVRYIEREGTSLVCNEYYGTVVSVDLSRGLRVSFEGLRREWVNEQDDWAWLQPGDHGWDEGGELWGEEAAEGRSSAELEPPLTKPTARKPRPPRRPRPAASRPAASRPASALSAEGGEGGGEGRGGGSGGATPLQPAAERAVRLGLRGLRGPLHRDAADLTGSGLPRGLARLERSTAQLEKTREAFLAHALTLSKACAEAAAGAEAGARPKGGAQGGAHGGQEQRGTPLKSRGAPGQSRAKAAGRGGLHLSPGGSPASSPRAVPSPRAAPLHRGDLSPLKASPRGRERAAGEAGLHVEVGMQVFCHQVGSRWTPGVVSRVFSSPKWLTVTLESGQTRPTQRDQLILDTPAPPDRLLPSTPVLAFCPPGPFWRKAELLKVLPEGGAPERYRVHADGEELHLAAHQLRLLPPAKAEAGAKRSRSGGHAAPAKPAAAPPATADPSPAEPPPADGAPPEPKRPRTPPLPPLPSPVEVEAGGAGLPGCS